MSHEQIESYITPSLKLITYNLGYVLAKGQRIRCTMSETRYYILVSAALTIIIL